MACKVKAARATPSVPADNRWFKLTVDNDRDPMGIIVSTGVDPEGWTYLGPKLAGKRIYRVKLVRLGYVHNLKDAEEKADALGWRLLEGQAREAMKAKYPASNVGGTILFGGSEWQDSFGGARVASLCRHRAGWDSDFHRSGYGFNVRLRWAVVEKNA